MSELKISIDELGPDNLITKATSVFFNRSGGFEVFKYAGAISAVAIATDRKISMLFPFGRVYPNLWILILGNSSIAGKSTTFDEYIQILNQANTNSTRLSDAFSREVLPQSLQLNPHRYMFAAEIAGLLAAIHKKNGHLAGLQDELAYLFDSPDVYQKELTKAIYRAEEIFINTFWCTTFERFEEVVEPTDLSGGLLARLLIFHTEGKGTVIPLTRATRDDFINVQDLIDHLSKISEMVQKFAFLEIEMSNQCYQAYNYWQDKAFDNAKTDIELTLIARLRSYIFKLAMVYYCGSEQFLTDAEREYQNQSGDGIKWRQPEEKAVTISGSLTMPDRYFNIALKHVSEYFIPMSLKVLTEAIEHNPNNMMQKVKKLLCNAADHQLTRSEILQKISGRLSARELNDILDLLEEDGKIFTEIDNSPDSRGRPKRTQIIKYLAPEGI